MARMTRTDRIALVEDLLASAEIRLDSYRMDTGDDLPQRDLNVAAEQAAQAQVHALLLIAASLENVAGQRGTRLR